ncbi:MAG: hypothetical protein K2P88_06965 [Chitinophagaceae bacterium]|uniref:hypothetical protein n=1 Tax=unclassified Paraflavitalea TaxID=2798305 RepID=UPI003D359B0A|nr:hypothetical protein [Chitinophagaceae bacterium]
MKVREFVENLSKLTPSKTSLSKLGYENFEVDDKINSYKLFPKRSFLSNNVIKSEVIDLIECFDCSKLQIGILEFWHTCKQSENYVYFGTADGDILGVNKHTLEVQIIDYLAPNWVVFNCASNGSYFLDALIACVELYSKRIQNLTLAEDNQITYEYVLLSSKKAGGEKYIDFYKVLLGYDL